MTDVVVFPVVVRRAIATGELELFFVGTEPWGKTYWIEGYTFNDGHFYVSPEYVSDETLPTCKADEDEVKQFLGAYDKLPTAEAIATVATRSLKPPAGYRYNGY